MKTRSRSRTGSGSYHRGTAGGPPNWSADVARDRKWAGVGGDKTTAGAAAALVIRVWQDEPGSAAIKARITRRPDLSTDEETTTLVSTPEQVYAEVGDWLETFLRTSRGGSTG